MKGLNILLLLTLLSACSQKKYRTAEDALDAAREFKDGCLKGDFDKATFYIVNNKEGISKLNEIEKAYNNKVNQQQKELKEAAIIITSAKDISQNNTQIVLSSSVEKKLDTMNVVFQNNVWLVDLQSSK